MHIDWKTRAVVAKVTSATIAAINEVTKDAAADARANHWWTSRSGRLQANIEHRPARLTRTGSIQGSFGATKRGGFHGLFLERRTPFLRPAADRNFPGLAKSIRVRIGL